MSNSYRVERDSLGDVHVPKDALFGAQTQRAIGNFTVAGRAMPPAFITALALIKAAAAEANCELGLLDKGHATRISDASRAVADGCNMRDFPVDVYQTGSGTSSNMNVNEVIAKLAGNGAHPNDHVNLCQSSNDVVPSALQVAVYREVREHLLPALDALSRCIVEHGSELTDVVKTGRTHLMDAMPLRLEQEFSAWAKSIQFCHGELESGLASLLALPLGGTAVGTGVNAHPEFAARACARLAAATGFDFTAQTGFRNLGSVDAAVAFSGRLNTLATALLKICNDLRWMNSGPLSGLGEIQLPALQPGSSIMPGKVNPVIPEAVAMACVQVSGLHNAVTVAGQSGNFQLNVMLPLVADNLLQSVELLCRSASSLMEKAFAGLQVNREALASRLEQSPVLATALNPFIGYEHSATIAKEAARSGRAVIDVAEESTSLSREKLEEILDPLALTHGGMQSVDS